MSIKESIVLAPESAGYELKLLRQRREITVGRIAYEVGISRSSVYRFEHGIRRIPSHVLVRWANYLGYDVQLAFKSRAGAHSHRKTT